MSTFTAIGPALGIDGPLPRPPKYRLFSVPGVLRDEGDFGGRWQNGVNVWGFPEDLPGLWEPCSDGTFREKGASTTDSQPRFDPFAAHISVICSTISAPPDEFTRRAELTLEATLSHAVEEALSQGVTGSTNPFFGDVDVDIIAGGPFTPEVGLAYLEDAIGATGRMGMIHATPSTVVAWGDDLLEPDGSLETINGTPVASGTGYIGATPSGGSAAAAGQSWAYATGPVVVYVADADPPTVSEFVDREDNEIIYRAERYVLALWDTSLQAAALIDWSP